jgi:hypothetical protein
MFGRVAALALGVAVASLAKPAVAQPAARLLPPSVPIARAADDLPPPRGTESAARLTLPRELAPVSADALESARRAEPAPAKPLRGDELFDHLSDGRRTKKADVRDDRDRETTRTSGSGWHLGDNLKDFFDLDKPRSWLTSDHAFDCFVSPVTNPFLFEDPRSVTELRPIFIYQKVPTEQPNFQGGNIWWLGTQARIAFTDRFSLTVNKLGATAVTPGSALYEDGFGFSELWLGPKYTFCRNEDTGLLIAGGAIFQIPVGSSKVYQDTGSLSIAPYVSAAYPFLKSRLGTFTGIGNAGYSFSTNRQRSDYFWASAHADFDVGNAHRFFPLAELNWFQYTTNGQANFVAGEGRDLINFGGVAKGSNLLTGALGARVKLTRTTEFGAAFEVPLVGNRDFFRHRITLDFIWRY